MNMDPQPHSDKTLQCVVVTPERSVFDQTADFVALPMLDGELGVLPGRAPLIGRLGFGELRAVAGPTIHRYYIDGGFAQVRGNVVTVLTSKAMPAQEIDVANAERALRSAQELALTPEAQEAHLKTQERARAQIRVAHKARDAAGA
jgi:F-type H+-transporting ATPase subunit epsilon